MNFQTDLKIIPGELDSGEIFIKCLIQDRSRECFLDSGSNTSFLNEDEFSISFSKIGESSKSGASGKTLLGDKIRIDSLVIGSQDIGPKEFGRFKNMRHDLIGLDLFSNKTVEFDLCNNKLSVSDESEELLWHFNSLAFEHISLPMNTILNADFKIIFDTGAGLNSVDKKFVEANPEIFKYLQDIEAGYDITGNPVIMKLYQFQDFSICGTIFKNQTFLSFDFGELRNYLGENTPFILGFNGITGKKWKFSFKNKKFSII